MEVIFFRHGIAVDQAQWKGDDAGRPLTPEGAERAKLAARGLQTLKVRPDVLLSSRLVRAKQTADLIKQELGSAAKIEVVDDLSPEAAPERILTRLATYAADSVVLCVGHEPHLSTTISAIISGKTTASIEMKKSAACALYFTGQPKAGDGTLLWLIPSKVLRLLGSGS